MGNNLYDKDTNLWIEEQIGGLRNLITKEIDVLNLIGELEDMGKRTKRSLVNHFANLIQHLYKFQYQSERRGVSWELSIANARDEIEDILDDNPSLAPLLDEFVIKANARAVRNAAKETGIDIETFPKACPWLIEQLRDQNFLPD